MSGIQRLFFNKDNLFIDGAVTANSTKSSTAYHVTDWDKMGGGFIAPSGTYTGDTASEFDIKIVPGTSASRYNSYPKTETNGNGTIENIAIADSTNPQLITATLVKKETIDTFSSLPITDSHSLVSVATGENTITLDIDTSNLVFNATGFVLPYDIKKGQNDWLGSIWDWDTKQITDDGKIPDDALRFIFAGDNEIVVYRQYKELRDDKWHYRISPTPTKNYRAGTIILSVSGGYSGTLTQTAPPIVENYPSFGITLYDMLLEIQSTSAIVRVEGIISEDRTPYTGIDGLDINLRTSGFAESITVEGRELKKTSVIDIDVKAGAPTETIKLECINNAKLGSEIFSVEGDITGELPNAVANIAYSSGIIDFTIVGNTPRTARADRNMGDINIEYRPIEREKADDGDIDPNDEDPNLAKIKKGEPDSTICIKDAIIGAAALNGVTIFTYTKKTTECADCDNQGYRGRPNNDLLGLQEGVADVAILDPDYKARLVDIYNQRETLVHTHTSRLGGTAVETYGVYFTRNLQNIRSRNKFLLNYIEYDILDPDPYDINKVKGVFNNQYFVSPLYQTTNEINQLDFQEFATSLEATNFIADLKTDETVTIFYQKPATFTEITERFDPLDLNKKNKAQFAVGTSRIENSWQTNQDVVGGKEYFSVYYENGEYLHEPTISDEVYTISAETNANRLSFYAEQKDIDVGDGVIDIARDSLDQIYESSAALASWDDMWADMKANVLNLLNANSFQDVDYFDRNYLQHYEATVQTILLDADIKPVKKSDGSELEGGDPRTKNTTADFHWVSDKGHLPATTNEYFHTLKEDKNGNIYSTQEFGFAVVSACPENILPGDALWVEISGVRNNLYTYQVGDIIKIPVASATPLLLEGGITGDYLQRWEIMASVDGKKADYLNSSIPGSETPYSDGGIGLTILNGTQPYVLGDKYIFGIEDKQFQYRRDSGAWSANKDIDVSTPVSLESGVSCLFDTGLSPSYEVNDTFSFDALQPHSYLNSIRPNKKLWTIDTPTAQIEVINSDPVNAILLHDHNFASNVVIQVEGLTFGDAQVWPKIAALWSENAIVRIFETKTGHDKIRVSFSNMTGDQTLGWLWVGETLETKHDAKVSKAVNYKFDRGGDIKNPNKFYKGKGVSLSVEWENLALEESVSVSDLDNIMAGIDNAQENNEPIGIVPNYLYPSETVVGKLDFESIENLDYFDYQTKDKKERIMSLSFELSAIYK